MTPFSSKLVFNCGTTLNIIIIFHPKIMRLSLLHPSSQREEEVLARPKKKFPFFVLSLEPIKYIRLIYFDEVTFSRLLVENKCSVNFALEQEENKEGSALSTECILGCIEVKFHPARQEKMVRETHLSALRAQKQRAARILCPE
jgi:hypothetical protein